VFPSYLKTISSYGPQLYGNLRSFATRRHKLIILSVQGNTRDERTDTLTLEYFYISTTRKSSFVRRATLVQFNNLIDFNFSILHEKLHYLLNPKRLTCVFKSLYICNSGLKIFRSQLIKDRVALFENSAMMSEKNIKIKIRGQKN